MNKLIAISLLMVSSLAAANPNQKVTLPDLRTDAGVKAAFNQISMAAENVCPYHGDRYIKHQQIFQRCHREAIESAVYRVHDMRLAEYAKTH